MHHGAYHLYVILIYAVFNKVLGNNGSSSGFKLLDDISKCSLKWNVYWFSLVLPKDIQRYQKTRSNWYFYCFLFLFFSLARTSICSSMKESYMLHAGYMCSPCMECAETWSSFFWEIY